jgi:hypothetical protein
VARSREIPKKCRRCAPLSPAEARAKHPTCWDDKLCTARRFYINNRGRINQKRARKRIETKHQIPVPQVNYGILQVWRELREDSPIHAIGIEERGYERCSVVRELSVAEALAEIKEPESDAVDSKLEQSPDPMDLAHQEVDPLVRAEIDRYLQGRVGVSISELAGMLDLSPVAVLLTVMESYQLVGKGTVFYRRWEEIELEY